MSVFPRYVLISAVAATLILITAPAIGSTGLLEAYQDAAESDPIIRAAAAERQASLEAKPQARALLLPDLRASGIRERNFAVDSDPGPSDSNFSTYDLNINVVQPLYDRAANVQVRQAESIVDQAEADFVAAQQDLILRVAQAFFDVLEQRDDLTFRTADLEAIGRQLEQAKRRFEVGLITITDVQEAQARFDLATADEIIARNDLEDSRERLRSITGQYYAELEELSDRMPLRPPDPPDPEAWVKLSLETNPNVLSAAFAVETARENIQLQRSGHYPTIDLTAGFGDSDTGRLERSGGRVGVQFNFPLYQGGAVNSRTREAAYGYEAAKERLEGEQRASFRDARNGYRGVVAAIASVRAFDRARVSNQTGLEATEAGFEVGTRTIVEVLNSQSDLFRARRDYSVARYAYILSFLALKRAAGLISVDDFRLIESWLDPVPTPSAATTR
jgi:outer membrane protein